MDEKPAHDPTKCQSCQQAPAEPRHACPYAEEINDDYDKERCNCCDNCRQNCCDDI